MIHVQGQIATEQQVIEKDNDQYSVKQCHLLIVDDEAAVLETIVRFLNREGYENIRTARSAQEVLHAYQAQVPDLMILDINMPEVSGYEVMEKLHVIDPHFAAVPVLIMTGDPSREVQMASYKAGARDFLAKPFDYSTLRKIENSLRARLLHLQVAEQNRTLEERIERAQIEAITRLAVAAELRDDETGKHTLRVGLLAEFMARATGQTHAYSQRLGATAMIHDLGKLGIPEALLKKPGALTTAEMDHMKRHAMIGARLLANSEFPCIQLAHDVALNHHEWWDGTGYPRRLSGEDIPFCGRVVALCDSFDVLCSDRPFRKAFSYEKAKEIIVEGRGTQFDPDLVDVFVHHFDEICKLHLDA